MTGVRREKMMRGQAVIDLLRRVPAALKKMAPSAMAPIVLVVFCLIQVALGVRGMGQSVSAKEAELPAHSQGVYGAPWGDEGAARGVLMAPIDDLVAQLNDAWDAQDWPLVLLLIDEVIAIDSDYPEIMDTKYYAHVNYGYQLMTEDRCTESLAQFREALDIRPAGEEALAGMDLLVIYCGTPVPGITPSPTLYVTPSPTFITPHPTSAPTTTPVPIVLPEPTEYTVRPGDTLYSLARSYSTTVQAIMQANGMMSYLLRVGDVIILPASDVLPAGPIVHIVQPGETLHSIARDYGTTVWALTVLNNLHCSTIYAYQALFVPASMQPGPIIHIVQPGESLYSIANTYDTTVSLIMLANDMSTYVTRVYQRIIIPPEGWTGYPPISIGTGPSAPPGGPPADRHPPPPAVRRHVVQPGDTLYGLAIRYGTTVRAIQAANGLTGSRILVGTTLIIP
jgi:LysM repeat protein